MKIKDIYQLVIEMGMEKGPRSKRDYLENLKEIKQSYEKSTEEEKEFFDKNLLTNPFSDTRILYGDPDTKIKKMLVGIDIGTEELLLIKELARQGTKIDLAVSHHPSGIALASLYKNMDLQEDVMTEMGVSVNIMEKILEGRIKEVSRVVAPVNKERALDAAKILNIPLACFHTVADNQVYSFLKKFLEKRKTKYVGDIIKALREIPEYISATKRGSGPTVFVGSEKSKAGKIVISGMTGGTEGTEEVYEQLAKAGVGTLIDMHISETRRAKAESAKLNVIVAGHTASDSIGMNLLMDKLVKKGMEIIPCSGFIRVKR